jgi:hypothetical protein
LILPFAIGLLLASCGSRTEVIERPVTPEPCRPGKPPELPDIEFVVATDGTRELAGTTPAELSALAAYVVADHEWHTRVAACPFIQLTGGDIRAAMSK